MDTIIKNNLILWAREKAGLSQEDFAKKMNVSLEKVAEWESGSAPITMSKAKHLAKLALIPLGALFADTPPEETLPIPDFRSVKDVAIDKISPELFEVIRDAQLKQDWYKEYLLNEEYDRLDFVGSLSISASPNKAAEIIRTHMQLSEDEHWEKRRNFEESLRFLIEKTEELGVVVLRNGIVKNNTHRPLNVEEFRGFVLTDDYAPLIFINGKDSKSAQIFTLIHEIAHIFLGESGLLDANMLVDAASLKTEKYCNQVAAEFLTPKKEFLSIWDKNAIEDENFDVLSRHFKVSRLVVISRAFQLKLIDWNTLKRFKAAEYKKFREQKLNRPSGGTHYSNLKYRVSPIVAQAIISQVNTGKMLYRDAFNMLGVKNKKSLQDFSAKLGVLV